ncbi:MAG: glycine cleavage T C-terminal barrel domain-containing protein, partial [Pseudomonadota bacterium]
QQFAPDIAPKRCVCRHARLHQGKCDGAADGRAVALRPEGRAPMRRGVTLYDAAEGGRAVGEVTSGGFGPTVGGPVTLALVEASMPTDASLWGDVRGKLLPVAQTARPFVPRGYKR